MLFNGRRRFAQGARSTKSDVSPLFLTYHMMKWDRVRQSPSDQRCTECGGVMMKTEEVTDSDGRRFVGYVCHSDKRVIWLRGQ